MATNFTGTDLDGILLTTSDELWIVSQSSFVSAADFSDSFSFNATSGNRLLVYGTIVSEDADAVTSETGSFSLTVEVMTSGVVSGDSDGIELVGNLHTVINNGTVSGGGDAAIQLFESNSGTILNRGTLFGSRAIVIDGGASSNMTIRNSGLISGESTGVEMSGTTNSLLSNSGVIEAPTGVSISSALGDNNLIQNSGQILSSSRAVRGFSGNETLENFGLIVAAVELGAGEDVVTNGGTISGVVDLGDGADLYTAIGDATATTVLGGAGVDRLRGGERVDLFDGGVDNDTLTGGGGDDELSGGDGNDRLNGGADEDTLLGGRGNDRLVGGVGNDVLDGGRDDDVLGGGDGRDTFVIGAVNGRDRIVDFADNVDTLDLTALGFATVAQATAAAANVNGNTVFTFGANKVTVIGITVNQIADDLLISGLDVAMPLVEPLMAAGPHVMLV